MNNKVSIVVPIYNSEKFISRCLDSIINQTYKNIEIILVNDGSFDQSKNIIKKYNDDRIKYIEQKNMGLSGARNTGIDNSTGEYIFFLDSDDCIELDSIELLINKVIKDKLDVCIGLLKYIKDDKEYNINRKLDNRVVVTGLSAINEMLLAKNIRFHAVAKLFKRELFDGVCFPIGRLYEDTGCIYKAIYKAKRVGYINKKIYNYYFNNVSISKSKFNFKKLDLIHFTNEIEDFLINNNCFKICKNNYYNFKVDSYISLYKDIRKSEMNKKDIEILNELFGMNTIDVLTKKGISIKNRIKFILKEIIYR